MSLVPFPFPPSPSPNECKTLNRDCYRSMYDTYPLLSTVQALSALPVSYHSKQSKFGCNGTKLHGNHTKSSPPPSPPPVIDNRFGGKPRATHGNRDKTYNAMQSIDSRRSIGSRIPRFGLEPLPPPIPPLLKQNSVRPYVRECVLMTPTPVWHVACARLIENLR